LNQEGLELVEQARRNLHAMCGWTVTYRGDAYWRDVDKELGKMLVHGTTDGKPYVEPQPEIPEGYRRATEADKNRRDRQGIFEGEWVQAAMGICFTGVTYRVPIDRIPTDEDARQRPTVMVRDDAHETWKARTIVAVLAEWFYAISLGGMHIQTWKQARFPYPGELD
jgi:hypothetical protein